MNRGGLRAAGFMDGFMSGFDFVDRLQRLDEERSDRRAREAQEDVRWQKMYDLREGKERDRSRGDDDFLTDEQLRERAQRRYNDEKGVQESRKRAREFRDWQMERLNGEYGLMEGRIATSPETGKQLIHRSGRWEALHE